MQGTVLLGVSLIALAVSTPVLAQSSTAPPPSDTARDSEDIIVTATKREQTLQDVPISVSVTSQATLEKAQIRDLIDLQSVVPSLKVSQFNTVGQTNFIIRGFGNGNGNPGIESSVGVFIDGVYRSRSSAALDDLPEVERIEVLRGPQSTLFGKNVSAGAISIVTRKPQFEFGGKAEASIGNYGLIQTRGTFTGPISETLAVRVSGTVNERDGYLHNLTTGGKQNDRNRWSLRGDVLWQPTSTLSVRVIADYNLIKERCCGVGQIFNGPATQFIGAAPPAGLGKGISDPARIFDRNVNANTDPVNRVRGEGISGQVDLDVGFAKLTSITAYRDQENQTREDVDFSGADLANRADAIRIKTFTQEFRLASNGKGPLSWLIGGFYQDEKLSSADAITYGRDIRAYADALSGGAIRQLETIQRGGFAGIPLNASIVPGSTYFQAGQGISEQFKLYQRSYSIFGQAEYKVTDRLTLTGGLAYLNDRKRSTANIVLNDPFSSLNLQNVPNLAFLGAPVNAFGGLGGLQFFFGDTANHAPVNYPNANESGILKGDKVTYAARAAYDLGFVNAYVSYSTGWKAGAVNLTENTRPPNAQGLGRTVNPENVQVYEAGLKAKFQGGYFNLAVFKQSIKGFQSNAYDGVAYNLVNAGKQSVRGFEVDTAYAPVRWLALTGAVTYLDPKYDSFTAAPCYVYDTARCPVNPVTGRIPPSRDLSGTKPAGIAKWSFSASATISQDFGERFNAYVRGEYDYSSNTYLTETAPPNIATWGINNVNASAGFVDKLSKLEVMVWARNLTKDRSLIGVFPTVAQSGSYSAYITQPRTYGVTLRKTF
ncbi:TonB-dependent receptor [Sphingomonas sp.]|uniref:TonB-dependent receptor n=1 Tax=Sphingomonas sp. TaxID=28214 RepID=UPI0025DA25BE|nr:TonB-dependent receptor [Sphingomonas sp.]